MADRLHCVLTAATSPSFFIALTTVRGALPSSSFIYRNNPIREFVMQRTFSHATGLSLLQTWNRQIRRNLSRESRPRSRLQAAVGYQSRGPVVDQLTEVDHLVIVILYHQHSAGNRAIRLAGFTGSKVRWGVQWGGPLGSKFDKDFSLPPMPGAKGKQVDLDQSELVELGIRLHRQLQNHQRGQRRSSRRMRLPNLWAAFEPSVAADVSGDGPELDTMCRRTGKAPAELLDEYSHNHLGSTLLPLNWVSHRWQSFVAVYADLARFPKRQVIRIRRFATDLQGYRGASEFDFYHSRFGRRKAKSLRRQRRSSIALCAA